MSDRAIPSGAKAYAFMAPDGILLYFFRFLYSPISPSLAPGRSRGRRGVVDIRAVAKGKAIVPSLDAFLFLPRALGVQDMEGFCLRYHIVVPKVLF